MYNSTHIVNYQWKTESRIVKTWIWLFFSQTFWQLFNLVLIIHTNNKNYFVYLVVLKNLYPPPQKKKNKKMIH